MLVAREVCPTKRVARFAIAEAAAVGTGIAGEVLLGSEHPSMLRAQICIRFYMPSVSDADDCIARTYTHRSITQFDRGHALGNVAHHTAPQWLPDAWATDNRAAAV